MLGHQQRFHYFTNCNTQKNEFALHTNHGRLGNRMTAKDIAQSRFVHLTLWLTQPEKSRQPTDRYQDTKAAILKRKILTFSFSISSIYL